MQNLGELYEFHQNWLYQPHIQVHYYIGGQLVGTSCCEYTLGNGHMTWLDGIVTLPGV